MDHFLSTSSHYLEIWSRILSVPWDLHALMEGFSPSMTGYIIYLRSNDSMSFRLQIIHSHFIDCTRVLWDPLSLLVVSLTLVTFTSLTSNQLVSTMFNFDTINCMDRFVLFWEAEVKTLNLVSTIQATRSLIIHDTVDYSW